LADAGLRLVRIPAGALPAKEELQKTNDQSRHYTPLSAQKRAQVYDPIKPQLPKTANIRNVNTRRAYLHAVREFADWCALQGFHEIADIEPLHVAAFWLLLALACIPIADFHDGRCSGIKGGPMRQSGAIRNSGLDEIDPVARHAPGNLAIHGAVGSLRRGLESTEDVGYLGRMERAPAG
jgi:hypothetical protein